MHTVIAFDVAHDHKRYRVVRALLDRSNRVQKSVFEAAVLEQAAYLRLRSKLEGIIDTSTDSLRYYRLCAACAGRIEYVGVGPGLFEVLENFELIGF